MLEFDTASFMNPALLGGFTSTALGELAVVTYTLNGVAFIWFVGLVLFKIFSIFRSVMKSVKDENDWELYQRVGRLSM